MDTLFSVVGETPEPASLVIWSVLAIVGIGFGWWQARKAG